MALVDDLIEWRNVVIAACGSLEIHRLPRYSQWGTIAERKSTKERKGEERTGLRKGRLHTKSQG
jgi:hypothetical protein